MVISTSLSQVALADSVTDQADAKGFIEGSSITGLLRNYYMNRNRENGKADNRDWTEGVMANYISGFTQGAEMVLVYDIDPPEILRLIEAYGVTNSLFVPAVLQILSSFPGAEKTDFSRFRRIVYGASPISEEVLVRSMRVFGFLKILALNEVAVIENANPGYACQKVCPAKQIIQTITGK